MQREQKKILIQQTCKYIDINIYDETFHKRQILKKV